MRKFTKDKIAFIATSIIIFAMIFGFTLFKNFNKANAAYTENSADSLVISDIKASTQTKSLIVTIKDFVACSEKTEIDGDKIVMLDNSGKNIRLDFENAEADSDNEIRIGIVDYDFNRLKTGKIELKEGFKVSSSEKTLICSQIWNADGKENENGIVYFNPEIDVAPYEENLTLRAGETRKPNVKFSVNPTGFHLRWKSTNNSVASVNDEGQITALTRGKAKIVCKIATKTLLTISVTVSAEPSQSSTESRESESELESESSSKSESETATESKSVSESEPEYESKSESEIKSESESESEFESESEIESKFESESETASESDDDKQSDRESDSEKFSESENRSEESSDDSSSVSEINSESSAHESSKQDGETSGGSSETSVDSAETSSDSAETSSGSAETSSDSAETSGDNGETTSSDSETFGTENSNIDNSEIANDPNGDKSGVTSAAKKPISLIMTILGIVLAIIFAAIVIINKSKR